MLQPSLVQAKQNEELQLHCKQSDGGAASFVVPHTFSSPSSYNWFCAKGVSYDTNRWTPLFQIQSTIFWNQLFRQKYGNIHGLFLGRGTPTQINIQDLNACATLDTK